ncbi:substrate-binding domain-containing protein [Nocardia coffeae]|uniref:substrate-binding domain-containing protein n=1 Tax=Nocardia coffeae TaxID=2873381 RepID=UPI001F3F71B4|nr:substrate-binding domain-containing protein [Nocardia coffeae]
MPNTAIRAWIRGHPGRKWLDIKIFGGKIRVDSYLVQIGLPVIALVVSLIAFFWEFVIMRRKRLGYRVQMDTPVTGEIESVFPGVLEQLQPDGGTADTHLQDLSIVLIRVENDGVTNIDSADYAMPDDERVGLRLHFPHRRIAGMAVTELSDNILGAYLEPGRGIAAHADETHDVGVIDLPKVPMNRRDHYKILAILSRGTGTGPYPEPSLHGKLKGGRVRATQSRTGLSRNMLAFIGFLVVVIVVQFGISLVGDNPPAPDCIAGQLTLVGSSAFEPVIRDAATAYRKRCPTANFTFAFDGSERGLTTVDEKGHGDPGLLAITDGPKGVGYPDLLPRPLAVAVFSVIVRGDLGVRDLTAPQIRDLFEGRITNWNKLGGPDLPVRLVNRAFGSGTRETFGQRLLGGSSVTLPEASCRTIQVTNPPGVAACEVPLTGDMLKAVADIPGAVGYSAYTEAAGYPGVATVTIDKHQPTRDEVLAHNYAFWGVEYAYSNGELPYDSLAAAFLRYLTDNAGKDIIRSHGGTPCGELADPAQCSPER